MKNILYIILIFSFSFTIISCAKKSGGSSGSSSSCNNSKAFVIGNAVTEKCSGTDCPVSKIVDLGSGNATSIELTKDGGFIIAAGKNVFKTDSDMKIPTLETVCYRSKKSLCP